MEYNLFDPFRKHVEAILIAELEKDLLYPLDPNIVFGVHVVEMWRHLIAYSVADAS